ncbi:hypothetical protein [Nostoc sp. DedQUE09]|uniref:hypothetical protein n=1 Tax=Nostoc sp. DedQUE09 TaxID=3075394 RepID=UPI002AD2B735|nr:hypothetical protein [Nostoc sp. DedQUE09]MDZ7953979.1 hypothetical protein [Nostoc sp. DedQUE09]
MTFLRLYRYGSGSSLWGASALGGCADLKQLAWKPRWRYPLPLGDDRAVLPEMLWQTVTAHNNPIV